MKEEIQIHGLEGMEFNVGDKIVLDGSTNVNGKYLVIGIENGLFVTRLEWYDKLFIWIKSFFN